MTAFSVPASGTIVAGKYRVERVIGTGGMGVVLSAMHVELGQRVAIKVLQSGGSSDHAERFRREARAVARLRSEHVARVIDFGQLTDQTQAPYVVMDFLEGRDLDMELAARGPLPIAEVVGLILFACEAIAEAHALGIVHRDIKPKNLFLARQAGGLPSLKVLDFGLAKVSPIEDPSITRSHDIFGSPAYMAPEQMRSSKDVDARADIWALGVTLYELVAGEGPFIAGSVPEVCARVLREDPPALRTKRADVPKELAAIVHRCLEKRPADRFPDVLSLVRALAPLGPPEQRDAARRVEAIVTTPRSDPSLPPLPNVLGFATTRDMKTSEELTLEVRTSANPAYAPTVLQRRGKLRAGAVVATAAGAAAIVGIAVIAMRSGPPSSATTSREAVTTDGPRAELSAEETVVLDPSAAEAGADDLVIEPSRSLAEGSPADDAPAQVTFEVGEDLERVGAGARPRAKGARPARPPARAKPPSEPKPGGRAVPAKEPVTPSPGERPGDRL